MSADLPHLPLEREHVGKEPQVQHYGGIPFLGRGVLLGLLQHSLEAAEQLQAYRHKAAVHRDCHGTLSLQGWERLRAILARAIEETSRIRMPLPHLRHSHAHCAPAGVERPLRVESGP